MIKKWLSKAGALVFALPLCVMNVFAADGTSIPKDKLLVLGLALILLGIISFLVINAQKRLASMKGKHVGKPGTRVHHAEPEKELPEAEDDFLPEFKLD